MKNFTNMNVFNTMSNINMLRDAEAGSLGNTGGGSAPTTAPETVKVDDIEFAKGDVMYITDRITGARKAVVEKPDDDAPEYYVHLYLKNTKVPTNVAVKDGNKDGYKAGMTNEIVLSSFVFPKFIKQCSVFRNSGVRQTVTDATGATVEVIKSLEEIILLDGKVEKLIGLNLVAEHITYRANKVAVEPYRISAVPFTPEHDCHRTYARGVTLDAVSPQAQDVARGYMTTFDSLTPELAVATLVDEDLINDDAVTRATWLKILTPKTEPVAQEAPKAAAAPGNDMMAMMMQMMQQNQQMMMAMMASMQK